MLANQKIVRLIFQGQLLRDDSRSLASYGIRDKCTVHCHIGTRPYQQSNSSNNNSPQSQFSNNSNRFVTETDNGNIFVLKLLSKTI